MTPTTLSFLALGATLLATIAYIRLAPSDPQVWHADPFTVERPAVGAWLVRPEGGDESSSGLVGSSERMLGLLDTIALATPRTTRLAGRPEDGRVTYVTRSRIMGFPDYTTVAARPDGTLAIFGRLRFGKSDLGVNRARITDWLIQLRKRLGAEAA